MQTTTANASKTQKQFSVLPFVRGGISGVLSWLVIHPADVVKVRMQIAGEGTKETPYKGFLQAARLISRSEGVTALYSGLSAALTRQISYTTLRLGLYSSLRESYVQDGRPISMGTKFAIGTAAGGIASAISTPVEVSMVRMYSDGAAEASKRRGYRNIFDALWRIAREEGVSGLWRGATPTVTRSMVANCVQLGTYDQAKEVFSGTGVKVFEEGVPLHLAASITSGFCYSVVTLPIDSAKTRVQNQRPVEGVMPYRNLFHAMVKVARLEGLSALWKGFTPYFSRCAGHTVVMFLVLEQVKKIF
ncbi:Mitochondrial carrier [Gracilaria domingensis]|nr:Mitochondrial carrier [Gracilaria domingensis]